MELAANVVVPFKAYYLRLKQQLQLLHVWKSTKNFARIRKCRMVQVNRGHYQGLHIH
jgi:hypothetical protein